MPNNIDNLIKRSAEESVQIETPKEQGDPEILSYLKQKYPCDKYKADFCQYRYKWGDFYGINFWESIYSGVSNFPTNRIFRRMILKVIKAPDGISIEVDTDEGDFR